MNKQTTIQIAMNQLTKLAFGEADSKRYPNRDKDALVRMLKIATNKTMHGKKLTTVIFQSKQRGSFSVKSVILMAGDDFVVFKGGQTIPIKSIIEIKA